MQEQNLKQARKEIAKELSLIGTALVLGIMIAYLIISYNYRLNIFMPDKVVAYMYTYTCDQCGYELAEGDYSIVSQQGFEFCPECHYHREFFKEKDGALFK